MGEPGAVFGFSSAVSDDLAVVGAPLEDARGEASGAIYVYERFDPAPGALQDLGPDWRLVTKITPSDGYAGDQFGYAVAIVGSTILAGAPRDSCGPSEGHATECGALYVFEPDGGGGWPETKLRPSEPKTWAWFGSSIAVDGDRLLVGAYGDSGRAPGAGGACVFGRDPTGAWIEVAKLQAPDGDENDWLGWSVALAGNVAVLGAYNSQGPAGQPGAGSGYVFERDVSGSWSVGVELRAADGEAFDRMGRAVAVMGGSVLVASHRHDQSRGAVYVFEPVGGVWTQSAELRGAQAQVDSAFGTAVAVHDDFALVSAPLQDGAAAASGTVFVFERTAGGWLEIGEVRPLLERAQAFFGVSLATSDSALLVGAPTPWDGPSVGAAWTFDLP